MSAPEWTRQNFKKTSNKVEFGVKDCGSLFHGTTAKQYLADGDTEETYKARGIEASANDGTGLFARLRAGNIDDPNSDAYRIYGAGRGMSEASRAASDIDNESTSSGLNEDRSAQDRMNSTASTMRAASDLDEDTRTSGVTMSRAGDFMSDKEPEGPGYSSPSRPSASVRRSSASPKAQPAKVTDTGDETARLMSRYPKPQAKPVARRGRINTSNIDPNTLLSRR